MTDINNAGAGGDGGGKPSWMSSLPDDLKSNEILSQFPSIGDAGKALVTLKGLEGKAVVIPEKDADSASWAAFYDKIGRPAKMEDYNITKPKDLPDDIPYRPEIEPVFKKFAHENGLTAAQAERAFNWYYDLAKQGHVQEQQRQAQVQAESETALKTEWGAKYDENREIARRAFVHYGKGSENLLAEARINGVRLGDHPGFVKLFHEIGARTMDDRAMSGGNSGGGEPSEAEKAALMFPSMKKG